MEMTMLEVIQTIQYAHSLALGILFAVMLRLYLKIKKLEGGRP